MRMKHEGSSQRRATRATNITLSSTLVDEAKELGVSISSAATAGLEAAVARKRAERWIRDNGPALGSYNAFVEERGLPLAKFRLF